MRFLATLLGLIVSTSALARPSSFMPPNDLHLRPTTEAAGGITKAQFDAILDRALVLYTPIFRQFGARLSIERLWNDNTVNAYADQAGSGWMIHMYGGLARRAEVTADGFAMVVCHELGHHIGGYPFYGSNDWASDEGQSDMHATGACAYKLFVPSNRLAAQARNAIPATMKAKCDAAQATQAKRDICYRAVAAGKSLADLLGALDGERVNYDTPDTTQVATTKHSHPNAQCRLDTYVAGALCGNANWDYALIPGKGKQNRNSKAAQDEAYEHSCASGAGARPRCWFAPVR